MKTLYVTSFNQRLLNATGHKLLESFLDHQRRDKLLCCHDPDVQMPKFYDGAHADRIPTYNLGKCKILRDWREQFDGVVARATSYWNRNAARWFRKVVSINHAAQTTKAHRLVWLDCDCIVKRAIPEGFWRQLFGHSHGKYSVFYLKGPTRTVEECGFTAYDLRRDGRTFIEHYLARYTSGEFLSDERWDDCFQFQRTRETHPEILCRDFAGETTGPYGPVFENSPLAEYLDHPKGSHNRMGAVR